ncbi:hypothetical protein D3C84_1016000 [compost metagenome]
MAFLSPSFIASVISRISLDKPLIACSPLCLFSIEFTSLTLKSSLFMTNGTTAGSRSPLRVPIISPSSGVMPMLVSNDLPS